MWPQISLKSKQAFKKDAEKYRATLHHIRKKSPRSLKLDFKEALVLENVIRARAKGFRVCRCFPKMWQETEIMYENTCCTHLQKMTLSTSTFLFLLVSPSLNPPHFMPVVFLYLLDKTMDNNPGIAQRPANESNQAIWSWWRSGSLIKP